MQNVQAATTLNPITRSFRYLLPTPRLPSRFRPRNEPLPLPVKNRIRQWNIVPGDKVRLITGPEKDEGRLLEVHSINKLRNRVYLKGKTNASSDDDPNAPKMARHVHYSNVQLFVGKHEFPPEPGSDKPIVKDVFATRMSTSAPYYHREWKHWVWNRYAAATVPKIDAPEGVHPRKARILVPWPKVEGKAKPEASNYDTNAEDALEATWQPFSPTLEPFFDSPSPDGLALQDAYLRSLKNPEEFPYDPSLPMEHYLERELSNPHSRAKKQARWQERAAARETLREEMIEAELSDLKGRTRGAARREAEWKWKQQVEKDEKKRKYERWVARGGLENMEKIKKRKDKKDKQLEKKLRELVLSPAKNQVIPGSVMAEQV